jgi:hypothetical protein
VVLPFRDQAAFHGGLVVTGCRTFGWVDDGCMSQLVADSSAQVVELTSLHNEMRWFS